MPALYAPRDGSAVTALHVAGSEEKARQQVIQGCFQSASYKQYSILKHPLLKQ
jgi:hypothetical protein